MAFPGPEYLVRPYSNALTPSSKRVDINHCHRHCAALGGLDPPSQQITSALDIRKCTEREKRKIISWYKKEQSQ